MGHGPGLPRWVLNVITRVLMGGAEGAVASYREEAETMEME